MKITIVQAEIETAIINYIMSQVAVKDDQEISIDLRATRGAEGYQADIDIRPKRGGEEAEPEKPKAPAPAPAAKTTPAAKPLGITEAAGKAPAAPKKPKTTPAATAPATQQTQQAAPNEQVEENAPETKPDTSAVDELLSSKEEAPASDDADVTEENAQAAAPARTSIFASSTSPETAEAPKGDAPKSIFANLTKGATENA